ncbi:MAG: protein phosphatase 2C domain-containing protein [Candidatus Buchananbacteria bacterium]|nr:protein phosphatase 2C domain-containing protein [Candidatus Buchananbacteria bacterium]
MNRHENQSENPEDQSSAEQEVNETLPEVLLSGDLDNRECHRFIDRERGIEALFLNNKHEQDALAITEQAIVVSDGMSSYGKSGAMSALLVERLAAQLETERPAQLLAVERMEQIITEIQNDPRFQNAEPIHVRDVNYQDDALATLIALKKNAEAKTIDYATIGDSPLCIFDYDPEGKLVEFQIINADLDITSANYTSSEVSDELNNPRTAGVGLEALGDLYHDGPDFIKAGQIVYQPGRVVVAATDFLTKIMAISPEASKATAERNPETRDLYLQKAQRQLEEFSVLWTENPLTKELMVDPKFFEHLKRDELQELLEKWKLFNRRAADDMTLVLIDLDAYFKEQ